MNQIVRINSKLVMLQKVDAYFSIFGSSAHLYCLNPTLTESEICEFEKENQITLPEGYRLFLLNIGDGGAGPGYGVVSLKDSILDVVGNEHERTNPSKPFLHTKAWNLTYTENEQQTLSEFENMYFDSKWLDGLIRLSHFGCGIYPSLVVSHGPEQGNIWIDDRCSDHGIYPEKDSNDKRINFLDWYEAWLDESLQKVQNL